MLMLRRLLIMLLVAGFALAQGGGKPNIVWLVAEDMSPWLGCYGDEERSSRQFVAHPATGEWLFRTGDLGRLRPDGQLEILGREDSQVKVNGFRVELGELAGETIVLDLQAVRVDDERHRVELGVQPLLALLHQASVVKIPSQVSDL